MIQAIYRLKHAVRLRAIEWMLAGITLSWGVMLLSNPDLFAKHKYWAEMVQMAPQVVWGWGIFLIGAIRFVALAVNGAWRSTPHIRAICAFFNVFVWMLVTFAIAHSGAASLGLAVCPWFVIGDGYSCFRAASDAGELDQTARLSSSRAA